MAEIGILINFLGRHLGCRDTYDELLDGAINRDDDSLVESSGKFSSLNWLDLSFFNQFPEQFDGIYRSRNHHNIQEELPLNLSLFWKLVLVVGQLFVELLQFRFWEVGQGRGNLPDADSSCWLGGAGLLADKVPGQVPDGLFNLMVESKYLSSIHWNNAPCFHTWAYCQATYSLQSPVKRL